MDDQQRREAGRGLALMGITIGVLVVLFLGCMELGRWRVRWACADPASPLRVERVRFTGPGVGLYLTYEVSWCDRATGRRVRSMGMGVSLWSWQVKRARDFD